MKIPKHSGKSLFQRWKVLDLMFYCCTLLLKSSDSWLSHLIGYVELFTFTNQVKKKIEGFLTLSLISRDSFTKQVQTSTQSPNFGFLLLWDSLVEDVESSAHCFLDWFLQNKPPCLSHLCLSLGAAWKESHVPVHGRGSVCFCLAPRQWRYGCLC